MKRIIKKCLFCGVVLSNFSSGMALAVPSLPQSSEERFLDEDQVGPRHSPKTVVSGEPANFCILPTASTANAKTRDTYFRLPSRDRI